MAEYHFWKEKRRTKKCLKDPNNSKSSKGSNGSDTCKIANHQNNCKNLNLCGSGDTTGCTTFDHLTPSCQTLDNMLTENNENRHGPTSNKNAISNTTLSVHYNTNSTINKSRQEVCLQTVRRWLERHFSLQKMSRTCRAGKKFNLSDF